MFIHLHKLFVLENFLNTNPLCFAGHNDKKVKRLSVIIRGHGPRPQQGGSDLDFEGGGSCQNAKIRFLLHISTTLS